MGKPLVESRGSCKSFRTMGLRRGGGVQGGRDLGLEQAAALVRRLAGEGQSLSDAAKQVAKETGYRKGELYRLAAGK